MRPAPALLLAALLAATLLPFDQQPAAASCAAPSLTGTDHLVLHPGGVVEVTGVGFADGCQDVGVCTTTLGCTRCDYGPEPRPMGDLTLRLHQRGRTWTLGTADADRAPDSHVTWVVDVPAGARPGRATLDPENGEPVRVRVE